VEESEKGRVRDASRLYRGVWRQLVAVSGLKYRGFAEDSEGQGRNGTRLVMDKEESTGSRSGAHYCRVPDGYVTHSEGYRGKRCTVGFPIFRTSYLCEPFAIMSLYECYPPLGLIVGASGRACAPGDLTNNVMARAHLRHH
jgi:hypothetical protein